MNILYGILHFNDDDFEIKLLKLVKEYGVVVIKNVITPEECTENVSTLVEELEHVSDFRLDDLTTWKPTNLPQQVRPGLFHEVICNTPTINKLRFDDRIVRIFTTYYSGMKNKPYSAKDMIVSNDGVNIKPGMVPPYDDGMDWAHLDQTGDIGNPYKCIQGQIVLSNTTAGFKASPKSHLFFKQIVGDAATAKADGFFRINYEKQFIMRKNIERQGGAWQIKIPAEKGDFIIWTSSTVHSAAYQIEPERPTENDRWNGWRCVVYICHRPRDEFTDEQLKMKYKSYRQNRATNHWSTTVFPKGFSRYNVKEKSKFSTKLQQFIDRPESVYKLIRMQPKLTPIQELMMGSTLGQHA
jgi:hypothetical protein